MGLVSFVGKKKINQQRIADLLSLSEQTNTYTNNGPVKSLLEKYLETLLKLPSDKKVFCFNNGTSALHALMFLVEQERGPMKWVTPSFTFPSSTVGGMFNVDILDIDPNTYTLPLNEELLREYDAIILTNLFGSYVDIGEWERFCVRTNKVLILDNASSPLSTYEGDNICARGHYAFGSLHHTKYLGFGEGGFAVVPHSQYNKIQSVSAFGYDDEKNFNPNSSNYKLSDVSAAYILSHLESYDIPKHLKNQRRLVDHLASNNKVKVFNYKPGTVYGNLPIICKNPEKLEEYQSAGVQVLRYYKPLANHSGSWGLYEQMLNFPLYAELENEDLTSVLSLLEKIK